MSTLHRLCPKKQVDAHAPFVLSTSDSVCVLCMMQLHDYTHLTMKCVLTCLFIIPKDSDLLLTILLLCHLLDLFDLCISVSLLSNYRLATHYIYTLLLMWPNAFLITPRGGLAAQIFRAFLMHLYLALMNFCSIKFQSSHPGRMLMQVEAGSQTALLKKCTMRS